MSKQVRIWIYVLMIVGGSLVSVALPSCGKLGVGGHIEQLVGNWAEVTLPPGCKVKQVAASGSTTVVLCEDGRVFH